MILRNNEKRTSWKAVTTFKKVLQKMTDYRKILMLRSKKCSQREMKRNQVASRETSKAVFEAADQLDIAELRPKLKGLPPTIHRQQAFLTAWTILTLNLCLTFWGHFTVAVYIHYKDSGALMRQGGAETPARWGSRSDLCRGCMCIWNMVIPSAKSMAFPTAYNRQ